MKLLDDWAQDDGYDSDGQFGPFIEKGVKEESDYAIDEVVPKIVNQNVENANNNTSETVVEAFDALNPSTIEKMKVVELRQELGMRGISKNGNKLSLVERLKELLRQTTMPVMGLNLVPIVTQLK